MANDTELYQFHVSPETVEANRRLLHTDIRPKVRIYAYQGLVIFDPREPEKWVPTDPTKPKTDLSIEEQWVPVGGGHLGSVVGGTEFTVGVSKEALELLQSIPQGVDCIGDFSWWECNDSTWGNCWALSWFGPLYRILDPKTSVTARGTRIPGPRNYQLIDNEISEEIVAGVTQANRRGEFYWREPLMISR